MTTSSLIIILSLLGLIIFAGYFSYWWNIFVAKRNKYTVYKNDVIFLRCYIAYRKKCKNFLIILAIILMIVGVTYHNRDYIKDTCVQYIERREAEKQAELQRRKEQEQYEALQRQRRIEEEQRRLAEEEQRRIEEQLKQEQLQEQLNKEQELRRQQEAERQEQEPVEEIQAHEPEEKEYSCVRIGRWLIRGRGIISYNKNGKRYTIYL